MSKRALLPLLLLLSLLIAGCQVFPYALSAAEDSVPLPTATQTPVPTNAPTLTPTTAAAPTATLPAPSATPTATATEMPEPIYVRQSGSPLYTANFAHPSAGCSWLGVAGQVFDANGEPISGLLVIAGNIASETGNQWAAQTGQAEAYGPGGYELQVADETVATTQTFWVQVVSDSGEQLSAPVFFDTYADCERNLVLINFVPADSTAAAHSLTTATLPAYP